MSLKQQLEELSVQHAEMHEKVTVINAEIKEVTATSAANEKIAQEKENQLKVELDKTTRTQLDSEMGELEGATRQLVEEKERTHNLQSSLDKSEMMMSREMAELEGAQRRELAKSASRVKRLTANSRALQAALDRTESKVILAVERSRLAEEELEHIRHRQSVDAQALRLDAQSKSLVQLEDQRTTMLQEQAQLLERAKREQERDTEKMLATALQEQKAKHLSEWRQQQAVHQAQLRQCEKLTAQLKQEHQEIIDRLEGTNAECTGKNVKLELEVTNQRGMCQATTNTDVCREQTG